MIQITAPDNPVKQSEDEEKSVVDESIEHQHSVEMKNIKKK